MARRRLGPLPRARRAATPRCSSGSTSRSRVGDLTDASSLARAVRRLPARVPLRRARLRLGHHAGDRARQRRRHAQPARGRGRRRRAALRPLQHHRRLRLSRPRGDRRDLHRRRGFATGTRRRSSRPRPRSAAPSASGLETVILRPATVYGPGSSDVVGEIARAIRARNMLLIDGGRASPVCATSRTWSTPPSSRCRPRGRARPGVQRQRRPRRHLAAVHRRPRRAASAAPPVRWSLPYWIAIAIGFSLEHGYRLLRTATGLSAPPLLSRQAVQVLGKNQDFSNRKARELLGWEPRVDYATGSRRRSRGCGPST